MTDVRAQLHSAKSSSAGSVAPSGETARMRTSHRNGASSTRRIAQVTTKVCGDSASSQMGERNAGSRESRVCSQVVPERK